MSSQTFALNKLANRRSAASRADNGDKERTGNRSARVIGRGAAVVAARFAQLTALAALSPVILLLHAGRRLHRHFASPIENPRESEAWLAEMQDFDRF